MPPTSTAEIARLSRTLWERLEDASPGDAATLAPHDLERALAPWARVCAGGRHEALLKRLAWDGIDPRSAAAALIAPADGAGAADWARTLERYAERARRLADPGARAAALARWQERRGDVPFFELWAPWLALAREELAAAAGESLGELEPAALADLEDQLLTEIVWLSELAAFELFEQERAASQGDPGVYEALVSSLLADPVERLYRHYPVLARQTCRRLDQWRRAAGELVDRLRRDRAEIAATFFGGEDPGTVSGVRGGVSDRHHDGRQVHLITFRSGRRLVYKPRSLRAEAALRHFFAWCEQHGLDLVPRTARVLERPGYGWMELVGREEPSAADGADDYYRRAGVLLALSHVLGAEDLTAENIVATRGGPVIVDAEIVLQPQLAEWRSGGHDEADGDSSGSCLATALLTQLLPWGEEDRAMGGLRGWTERARQRRVWSALGTDAMRVEAGQEMIGPLPNALLIGGRRVDPESHREALLEGFETAYRFVLRNREEIARDGGPLDFFRGANVRVLFRASQEYGRVLQLTQLPRNQRSGLMAGWLQEAMLPDLSEYDAPPEAWPLMAEERRALDRGDVPLFCLPAEETVLRTSGGTAVAGLFARSGLEATRRRLAALSEEDLALQLELAGRALAPPPPPGPVARELASWAGRSEGERAGATAARRLAVAIGDELLAATVERSVAGHSWDLAEGRLGTALFLAALAAAECGDRFEAGASRQLAGVEEMAADPWRAQPTLTIGGFNGLGSIVWGLVWLARLLQRPSLLAAARSAARGLTAERLAGDRRFDLTAGAGGALLGLLTLAEAEPDPGALDAARRCGEHLLAHQQVCSSAGAAWPNAAGLAQTGWAHGAGGVARALAALGEASGDRRFLVAAAAAIGYERSLFNSERRNWPVLVVNERGERRRRWMVASCRGAPGVALSRILLPPILQDEVLAMEREMALATTASEPPSKLDHLCCGTLGRSSILLTAAERGGAHLEAAADLARGVVARAAQRGRFSLELGCYENRLPRPDLLKGAAGVGYQLLRLSGARGLPDVLALELPGERARREGGPEPRTAST